MDTTLEIRVTMNTDMSLGEALALETALRANHDAVLAPLQRALAIQLVAAHSILHMRSVS